jgi:hypothetical protein
MEGSLELDCAALIQAVDMKMQTYLCLTRLALVASPPTRAGRTKSKGYKRAER